VRKTGHRNRHNANSRRPALLDRGAKLRYTQLVNLTRP
jgi:hypothetical protein